MESFYQKMQALKQNPATANAGSRLSAEEVGKLLNSIKANKSMKDIAIEHQRTEGSIVSKLLTIGESYVAEGKDIKEVAKMLNVSVSAIQELIEKNKDKPKKKLIIKYKEDEEEVKEPPKVIVLTEEQQGALNAFKSKKNLFLTGVAGAGKSVTLKRIVENANKKEW